MNSVAYFMSDLQSAIAFLGLAPIVIAFVAYYIQERV